MVAVLYVVVTAALVVLWGVLSSRFPRLGGVANAAAIVWLVQTVVSWQTGVESHLGWTILGFITAAFGMLAATVGLLADRHRAVEDDALPRAIHGT